MSFAYCYEYSMQIFGIFLGEGQVSLDDERYLFDQFLKWIEKYFECNSLHMNSMK